MSDKQQRTITPVGELPTAMVEAIKSNGLFRCGVISPTNCILPPGYEIRERDGMRRLFCWKHARHFWGKDAGYEVLASVDVPKPNRN